MSLTIQSFSEVISIDVSLPLWKIEPVSVHWNPENIAKTNRTITRSFNKRSSSQTSVRKSRACAVILPLCREWVNCDKYYKIKSFDVLEPRYSLYKFGLQCYWFTLVSNFTGSHDQNLPNYKSSATRAFCSYMSVSELGAFRLPQYVYKITTWMMGKFWVGLWGTDVNQVNFT